MRIACYYPNSLFSAWSVSEGLVDTLRRMGHDVIAAPIDPKAKGVSRKNYPAFQQLRECDAVLVSGPEHLWQYIYALYVNWRDLKTPKIAWMHETVERSDYGKLPIEKIKPMFDHIFSPAAQDEKYGLEFLPFGVDTGMFDSRELDIPVPTFGHDRNEDIAYPVQRTRNAVFIGLLYEPRQKFLKEHGLDSLIHCGNCQVVDLDGVNVRKSVELYASELRRSKVLVNLPSLCRHAVTKVFEGAACGAVVVTHNVEDERNHVLKSALYYDSGEKLKWHLEQLALNDDTREGIARRQMEEIQKEHRLELRLEKILAKVGVHA